jgi:hypothetical protein
MPWAKQQAEVRGKLSVLAEKKSFGNLGHEISLFISLLAQRNEPKKGPPVSLVPPWAGFPEFMPRMGYSSMLPGLCKLAALKQCKSPFVLPRLADGGGKRRGNCLRAKPEFFRVPPSSRSKGSPQGQDWLGCLFLVSSFGHAKEERENNSKIIAAFPAIPG